MKEQATLPYYCVAISNEEPYLVGTLAFLILKNFAFLVHYAGIALDIES